MATNKEKWIISALAGIIFYVVASSKFFLFVDTIVYSIFNVKTIDKYGKPNNLGLLLHTILFTLITRILMEKNILY